MTHNIPDEWILNSMYKPSREEEVLIAYHETDEEDIIYAVAVWDEGVVSIEKQWEWAYWTKNETGRYDEPQTNVIAWQHINKIKSESN